LAVTVSHGPFAVNASHGACGALVELEEPDVLGAALAETVVVLPAVGGLHGLEQLTVVLGSASAGAAKASGVAIRAAPITVRRRSISSPLVFARETPGARCNCLLTIFHQRHARAA
jgi:hypothetical protein